MTHNLVILHSFSSTYITTFSGGPLEEGDIEELDKNLLIICPWHSFDFNLATGVSSTGLKVKIPYNSHRRNLSFKYQICNY